MFTNKFTKLQNPSSWRRISIANWGPPNDPTVYGKVPLDFTKAKAFLEKINQNSDTKVTVTHLMAKTIALILKRYPDLNGIIRWRRVYLRKSIDIFLQVAIAAESKTGKPDLSGAKIDNCDQKSLTEIAAELKNKSQKIRTNKDPQFKLTLKILQYIPTLFLSWGLRFISFLIYDLNLNLAKLGIPPDPFGSAMVTSVGMLGAPAGYAPLVPISRNPLIICVGEVQKKPWVENETVVAKDILDMTVTFDHRFIDGLTGSKMVKYLREIIENPTEHLS